MIRIPHGSENEKFELCITHLKRFIDLPNETLDQRIERTTIEDARNLIALWTNLFRNHITLSGYEQRIAEALTRKFRDAGRRSPPWQPGSETGHRRPQDGADGNRQNRWLFEPDHKFYATEEIATLCEIRYYLQTLSMVDAPELPKNIFKNDFTTILGHPLIPGSFLDPIKKIPVKFIDFYNDRRYIESGHIIPLGRGGTHRPDNATLMLRESNRLQADLTLPELLEVMSETLKKHGYKVSRD